MVRIQKNISLKNLSNYRIGGPASFFAEVKNPEELSQVLKDRKKLENPKIFVLGEGTNVLFKDSGFDGLVIKNKINGIKILDDRESKSSSFAKASKDKQRVKGSESQRVKVGAGVLLEDLLAFCIENSLSGFQWAGGLPGTLGGAVRGNAGAFGGEIKDNIIEVESLDSSTLEIKKRSVNQCKFGYRTSVFKSQKESEFKRVRESKSQSEKESESKRAAVQEIIISATLSLTKRNRDDIASKIQEKIDYRNLKHPLEYPNIGSIFKNIPVEKVPQKILKQLRDSIKNDPFPILPTAKLLAVASLKGKRQGGAMVSKKHPNFIINFNNATSEDVKTLIHKLKEIIKSKYGIELEEEISNLG